MTDPLAPGENAGISLWKLYKLFHLVWLYFAAWGGTLGAICGLISFLIPGRIDGFKLNGKGIETVGEKLAFTALFLVFAIIGHVGLSVVKWSKSRVKKGDPLRLDSVSSNIPPLPPDNKV